MTDEQIKQNAKEIAKEAIVRKNGWHTPDNILFEDAYIAGVHSRDKEVERLKKKLLLAQKELSEFSKLYKKEE